MISPEISDTRSIIKSKERGLTNIPERGWQYYHQTGWRDDPTLAVTPQRLVWSDEFEFLDSAKWSHLVTTHPPQDFQYYRNNRANSWVSEGQLHLMASLTAQEYGEEFLTRGHLDLLTEDPAQPCNISSRILHARSRSSSRLSSWSLAATFSMKVFAACALPMAETLT